MPQAKDFDGGLRGHHGVRITTSDNDQPPRGLPCCEKSDGPCARCAERTKPTRALERFLTSLLAGDRSACRDQVRESLADGNNALETLERLVWPACTIIDGWSRRDQIDAVHQHCATMLLLQIVQRLEPMLARRPSRCRLLMVSSGQKPLEELAAEVFAGLAEADGFDVLFLGGGVESDDLFAAIGSRTPDFVVSYAAAGQDAPRLRRLLTALKEHDPVPGLRVGVGGGVFSRAPGLAEELGVDFSADTPFDLLEQLRQVAEATPAKPNRARAA